MAAKTTSPHHVPNSQLTFPRDQTEMEISPKDLNIVWGGDSRYWNVPKDDTAAVLNQVYWLEVTGCVDGIQSNKLYEVEFHVSLTPDAFGFGGSPLYVMVKRGKEGKFAWSKTLLDLNQKEQSTRIKGKLKEADPNQGRQEQSENQKLYFGLYEVWSGKWKGGLKIHKVLIREFS